MPTSGSYRKVRARESRSIERLSPPSGVSPGRGATVRDPCAPRRQLEAQSARGDISKDAVADLKKAHEKAPSRPPLARVAARSRARRPRTTLRPGGGAPLLPGRLRPRAVFVREPRGAARAQELAQVRGTRDDVQGTLDRLERDITCGPGPPPRVSARNLPGMRQAIRDVRRSIERSSTGRACVRGAVNVGVRTHRRCAFTIHTDIAASEIADQEHRRKLQLEMTTAVHRSRVVPAAARARSAALGGSKGGGRRRGRRPGVYSRDMGRSNSREGGGARAIQEVRHSVGVEKVIPTRAGPWA